MRLPQWSDFVHFSRWDGLLVALAVLVSGALVRSISRRLRQRFPGNRSLTTSFHIGTGVMVAGFIVGTWSWLELPAGRPGVWGATAIVLVVLSYIGAIETVKGQR